MENLYVRKHHAIPYKSSEYLSAIPDWECVFARDAPVAQKPILPRPAWRKDLVYRIGGEYYAEAIGDDVSEYYTVYRYGDSFTYELVRLTKSIQIQCVLLSQIPDAYYIRDYAYTPKNYTE